MSRFATVAFIAATWALAPWPADAQVLGTFRWQLQPFCNVLTLAVTQNGGVYRLEGTDDQCGAAKAASATGTAFSNRDGSIGFGLAIVSAPSGTPVHVDAAIGLNTLSGTWHDSAGNTGSFVFTPGAGSGGDPRPSASTVSGIQLGFGLLSGSNAGTPFLMVNRFQIEETLNVRTPDFGSFAMGPRALASAGFGAFANTAFGDGALAADTTGDWNTAFGHDALPQNTSGLSNVAVGGLALRANTVGDENVAVGTSALEDNVSSHRNVAVGHGALHNLVLGNNNVGIGVGAGGSVLAGNSNIYIANAGLNLDSNTIRIGASSSHLLTYIAGIRGRTTGIANAVAVVVDSAGQLGTVSSSRRFKEDIGDLGEAAREIHSLRPVSFRYTQPYADGSKPLQYGLIAEEVAEVLPGLVAYGNDGQPESVMYHVLPTLLLAEVQRLERERAAMAHENEAIRAELAALRALVKP